MSLRRFWVVAVVLSTMACGGQATATPSPSPDLAAAYLKLVVEPNAAAEELNAAANTNPLDLPRVQKAAKIRIDADVKFSAGLLAMEKSASTNVVADIETARRALSTEIASLQAVQSCTDAACANRWLDKFYLDFDAATPVFVLLRSDLGLPPPPVSSPSPN